MANAEEIKNIFEKCENNANQIIKWQTISPIMDDIDHTISTSDIVRIIDFHKKMLCCSFHTLELLIINWKIFRQCSIKDFLF